MNILYVSHLHLPEEAPLKNMGGMQRVSMQLLHELQQKEGVQVRTEVMKTTWNGIGFKTFRFLLKELINLPRIARECNADVILFSSMVTASLAWFIRKRVSAAMVTINHGQDVTLPVGIYQRFLPHVFASLDGVISVSTATRQACMERGMDPEKGVALPNGFNLERLDRFPDKEASRQALSEQFGIPLQNRRMLLTVGRLVKRKGHEWFIRNVLPEIESDVVYVIVGDGPESAAIRRAVEGAGCSGRIFMLGRQPEEVLKQTYAAADLFVMPNIPVAGDMEGFGIVMLEAGMASTPTLASDLEGIRDVIEDGKNGFKIPPLSADRFAVEIDEIIHGNIDELSKETRRFTERKFSWKQVSERYLAYFEEVVERSNSEVTK